MMKENPPQRKMITVTHTNLNTYQFEGKVEFIIKKLQGLIDQFGPDVELDYDMHNSWDSDYSYRAQTQRLETDQEFTDRLAAEQESRASQLAHITKQAAHFGYVLAPKTHPDQ